MGFGSYDESEQENKGQTDLDEGKAVKSDTEGHNGEVDFDVGDTDELLEKLEEIKGDE